MGTGVAVSRVACGDGVLVGVGVSSGMISIVTAGGGGRVAISAATVGEGGKVTIFKVTTTGGTGVGVVGGAALQPDILTETASSSKAENIKMKRQFGLI